MVEPPAPWSGSGDSIHPVGVPDGHRGRLGQRVQGAVTQTHCSLRVTEVLGRGKIQGQLEDRDLVIINNLEFNNKI